VFVELIGRELIGRELIGRDNDPALARTVFSRHRWEYHIRGRAVLCAICEEHMCTRRVHAAVVETLSPLTRTRGDTTSEHAADDALDT